MTRTTVGGGGDGYYCRSFSSKVAIRRTQTTRGAMTLTDTTIVTAREATPIETTTMTITTMRKVNMYPQIEKRIRRNRKKGPTRRLPMQQKTDTNSSPLHAYSSLPVQMPPCNEP